MHKGSPISEDKINQNYQYDTVDVKKILEARLKCYASIGSSVRVGDVATLGESSEQAENLIQVLQKENVAGNKYLLIPCNIPSSHVDDRGIWVGIILETQPNGKVIRAVYIDPLFSNSGAHEHVQRLINLVHANISLEKIQCIINDDHKNSGPYLIENFMATLGKGIKKNPDALSPRLLDIKALFEHDKEFYNTFVNIKQKQTFSDSQEEHMPVSENIEELFTTVTAMNQNIKDLLSGQADEKNAVSIKQLQEQYKAVCDEGGVIKLQLRYVANNRNLSPFLYRPLWRDGKIGFMRDYSYTPMIGVIGLFGSIFKGPGVTFAYEAATAGYSVGVMEAIKGAATGFNPLGVAATVVTMGGTIVSEQQSRKFAANIQEALYLYNSSGPEHDDETLKLAEKKINDEFGLDADNAEGMLLNDHFLYRTTRWLSTSREQYEFAHLLRAQIMASRNKAESLSIFTQVFDAAQNEAFKAMSLIGKICMLSDKKKLVDQAGGEVISKIERNCQLNSSVLILNKHFPEMVHRYLGMALQAYFDLEQIISIQGNKAFLEFKPLREKIDAIINFKELHCLRYLQLDKASVPAGKIAETVFTFAQALCHQIIGEHLKANNKSNDKEIVAEQKKEANMMQEKLRSCIKLINEFGLRAVSANYPKLKYILEIIDNHTKKYLEQEVVTQSVNPSPNAKVEVQENDERKNNAKRFFCVIL